LFLQAALESGFGAIPSQQSGLAGQSRGVECSHPRRRPAGWVRTTGHGQFDQRLSTAVSACRRPAPAPPDVRSPEQARSASSLACVRPPR